ncbi:MAG: methyltransferase [Alphaproteobacteria bacterium]|nr:methyltransferase [Alphaproteobacteria bacterium]
MSDPTAFIRANTVIASASLVPELRLHLATSVVPLWEATESTLQRIGLPPPYWAFAWPGGQAIARHILDSPRLVGGRRVLDLAAGCGIAAIAAARAGAGGVAASEIDRFALAAIALNAALNDVEVAAIDRDMLDDSPGDWDTVLAGDLCYERPMADRVASWVRAQARSGVTVLMGDPGRAYKPADGLAEVARYMVPTSRDLEDRDERETVVWRVLG